MKESVAKIYAEYVGADGLSDHCLPNEVNLHPQSFGPYKKIRLLGKGGQGHVYLCEDQRVPGRLVAVKVLSSLSFGENNRRLRREAEIAALLDHPGICPILDVDFDIDEPRIVMRFIDGQTLSRYMAGLSSEGADQRPQPWREVLELIEKVAEALHFAHEANIVHRDVKPGNIIIDGDGYPVILDFGLARDLGGFDENGGRCHDGDSPLHIAGTVVERQSDHRSTIGCVFFGSCPF